MAKKYFTIAKLSDKISKTPEGFLLCQDVPITRTGDLIYAPSETPVTPNGGPTIISRSMADIHDPQTIASFEGKPVVIGHPTDGDGFVYPENWKELAVGVIQNVRPGEGDFEEYMLADLLITDAEAIYAVESKTLREVSCGYEAEWVEIAPGRGMQKNIVGNHVALVAAGRCGSECAIFDHAPYQEIPMKMSDKLKALLASAGFLNLVGAKDHKAVSDALTKVVDEAAPDLDKEAKDEAPPAAAAGEGDVKAILALILERLAKIEQGGAAAATGDEPPAGEVAPEGEEKKPVTIEDRMSAIEDAILKMAEGKSAGSAPAGDAEAPCEDQETIARAEILAPGVAKTGDVKRKSLDAAYATEEGKTVIDTLLGGKSYDSADHDLLFIGASELMKGVRRESLNVRVSLDQLPSMQTGSGKTAAEINDANAKRYAQA